MYCCSISLKLCPVLVLNVFSVTGCKCVPLMRKNVAKVIIYTLVISPSILRYVMLSKCNYHILSWQVLSINAAITFWYSIQKTSSLTNGSYNPTCLLPIQKIRINYPQFGNVPPEIQGPSRTPVVGNLSYFSSNVARDGLVPVDWFTRSTCFGAQMFGLITRSSNCEDSYWNG